MCVQPLHTGRLFEPLGVGPSILVGTLRPGREQADPGRRWVAQSQWQRCESLGRSRPPFARRTAVVESRRRQDPSARPSATSTRIAVAGKLLSANAEARLFRS
jgi:hypothetical protein